MNWLTGRFAPAGRRLILVAAVVLVPVWFLPVLPVWQMRMWAPQYSEGLTLTIYPNTIGGDIQKINTLNHYVGMKQITASDFKEFTYLPALLSLFGIVAALTALINRRWIAVLGWLVFTGFSAYMVYDYVMWLWRYGHELDPRAAIRLPAFMPPVIGYSRMANFKVLSLPGVGTLLLGAAWLLGPLVLWLERRAARAANPARGADGRTPARTASAAVLVLAATALAAPGQAAVLRVPATEGAAARALVAAGPGDSVVLAPGIHRGGLRVTKAILLRGEPGAIVDGGGTGSVVTVACDGASVEGLEVRASGRDVMKLDSGIQVLTSARVRVENVVARDVLYGISAERAAGLEVVGCTLSGRVRPGDETGSGNGIHLWYCTGGVVRGNRVERFLDAVYLSFAHGLEVESNHLAWNGRYGLHTMYCQENRLVANTFTHNVAGCALMFSNRLVVEDNDFVHNRGPRTYGLLLRDCSDGTFTGNRMADNTVAVFLDGSNRNRFGRNLVENNGWGLLLFASCRGNEFAGNNFIANDYPVALDMRRTDNRFDDGARGNYWSDNGAYDLDDDGVADEPYAPVSAFAFVSKQYPDLTILARSPAVAALGVAERLFPSLSPSEAVDRFPRVRPVRLTRKLGDGTAATASAPSPRASGAAGAAGAGYAALLGLGLAGLWGTGRGRIGG